MVVIRTQDRKRLFECNDVELVQLECNGMHKLVENVNETDWVNLGTYATKERALEVLDEIEGVIKNGAETYIINGHVDTSSRTYGIFYQMPKE